MKKNSFLFVLILLLLPFLSGCSLPWSKKTIEVFEEVKQGASNVQIEEAALATGNLKKFRDYQEAKDFLIANNRSTTARYYSDSSITSRNELNLDMAVKQTNNLSAGSSINDDYSRTNIQVAGVDEADIIKTDGEYIFALVYKDLYVIKARPAEQAKAITKLPFPDRPLEIYVDNGLLIVIGADYQIMSANVYQKFKRQSPYTFVKVFDISNPEDPKQVRDLKFEGDYNTSRLLDQRLYLIINNYSQYITGETVVPRLVDGGKILANDCGDGQNCFAPDIYYFDAPYESYNLTSINTIDLRKNDVPVASQSYLLNGAQNIYVSAQNIFITYTQYLNELDVRAIVLRKLLFSRLNSSEQDILLQIESLDNIILNQTEKRQKMFEVFQRFLDAKNTSERASLETEIEEAMTLKYKEEADNWERTLIYKFNLKDGIPVYRAQGSVPGSILNQFSLDEDEQSFLRIATTRNSVFSSFSENRESYSSVYILSNDLKITGSLEKLAPGERIYSVRFMGKRAYLVTFKQVDPLFVVDLKDSQVPRLLGELKIPGFSSYLHPYDENTLIGLGRDMKTDVYGNVQSGGIKLSLFDVSDPSSPKELDSYIAGEAGSDSLAITNHKAFLFSKQKNILAIPASLTNLSASYRPYFSGALVFSIDEAGGGKKFNLRAQIDHSDGGRYQQSDYWCGNACYDNSVQRVLYIQDALYTFSNKYLKVNYLSDLKSASSIKLLSDTELDLKLEPLSNKSPLTNNGTATEPEPEPVLVGPNLPQAPVLEEDIPVETDEEVINFD